MLHILETFIRIIIYFGLIAGILLVAYPFATAGLKRAKCQSRFRKNLKSNNNESKKINNKILRHIEKLLLVTLNSANKYSVTMFFVISLSLFLLMFSIVSRNQYNFFIKIFLSLVFACIPYIILRLKLHSIRIESSYEGELLTLELTNQYKINYCNMIEAVDKTIPRLKKGYHTKKILFRLAIGLKEYKTKKDLDKLIEEFVFAINTQWSILLANNIYISVNYGDNVASGLDDICDEFRDLKTISEKNKQNNYESFIMIKYITPGTYLFTIFVAINYFNFTFNKFVNYQLHTTLGFKFFLLTVGSIIANYIIYLFTKKSNYDF